MKLTDLLKDSHYKLTQFSEQHVKALEERLIWKELKHKNIPYLTCLVRNKLIQAKPEEIIRQLYLLKLTQDYGYPTERIQVEHGVNFGREIKRADILLTDPQKPRAAYIIVEVKKPKLKDGKDQLRSYCNATGSPMGVWTNGDTISHYHRKDPNYFEDIPNIPRADQRLTDILTERWTIQDLSDRDKLTSEKKITPRPHP